MKIIDVSLLDDAALAAELGRLAAGERQHQLILDPIAH